ncbi:GIY-YIG nuclease family protein [Janthinobacterium sp. HSC-3S05]|uniref:GIY-YIG nuclease family protein n=1 Tax=Janthinobacterium lividum TaxID=29581 RepID=UPI001CD8CA5C|nr:GIY-YIG nuclease family protein [Janthinobacterium lividum]MCA1859995.1 GIY-YIG nuclease family protein [Janthinobacterium lividum]
MHEAFEVLPFAGQPGAAGEQEWSQEWSQEWTQEWEEEGEWEGEWESEWKSEWEGERARPGGGRGAMPMRGGGLRARPPLRGPRRPAPPRYQGQGRRPPRYPPPPLPYPPRYRGWGGYGAIYPTIYPAPYQDMGQYHDQNQGQDQGQDQDHAQYRDQDGDQMQGEVPPILASTLGRVPGAAALRYQAVGAIPQAVSDAKATGPGLYVIEFDTKDGRRAYSGQTDDLRRRLKQHHLCGKMMGMDMSAHDVYVAPLSSAAQRRSMEKDIHSDMFTHRRGVLTNQRRELEMAVLGEMWG